MKITVITVTFNSAATLVDTLRSVESQSHTDIEHIIIDGASKDGTLDVIRRHGRRVSRVLSEPDDGIYAAMNKGLEVATGEFIGFLNADDMYADANSLAEVASAASDPGVDAVYGDLVYVRRDRPDEIVRYWRSGECSRRQLAFGWMPPHPTFYVRRARIDRHGGFDNRLHISADYDFMLRLLRQPDLCVVYINTVLVRMRTGGVSNRSLRLICRKSMEDLTALKNNAVGGWLTLLFKNARKLPQFMPNRSRPRR